MKILVQFSGGKDSQACLIKAVNDYGNEKFCMFDSAESSMEYHSRLLSSKRYRRCFLYKPTDFHNWLLELKAAGYATDRHYVRRCEKVIKVREYRRVSLNSAA